MNVISGLTAPQNSHPGIPSHLNFPVNLRVRNKQRRSTPQLLQLLQLLQAALQQRSEGVGNSPLGNCMHAPLWWSSPWPPLWDWDASKYINDLAWVQWSGSTLLDSVASVKVLSKVSELEQGCASNDRLHTSKRVCVHSPWCNTRCWSCAGTDSICCCRIPLSLEDQLCSSS